MGEQQQTKEKAELVYQPTITPVYQVFLLTRPCSGDICGKIQQPWMWKFEYFDEQLSKIIK